MNNNTIINFPKDKTVRINDQILEESRARSSVNFADMVVQEITQNLMMDFSESGLDTTGENFNKDFHLLVLTLEALIYRSLSIPHDYHQVIDETVDFSILERE